MFSFYFKMLELLLYIRKAVYMVRYCESIASFLALLSILPGHDLHLQNVRLTFCELETSVNPGESDLDSSVDIGHTGSILAMSSWVNLSRVANVELAFCACVHINSV